MSDEIDEAGARARGGDCSRRMHEAIYDEERFDWLFDCYA